MGGIFGVVSKEDCVLDLFFGTDYHSHLGTKRGGMAVYGESGFNRAIHNIENSPFRTKFERDVEELHGKMGIGCISDTEPQPLLVQSPLLELLRLSRSVRSNLYALSWREGISFLVHRKDR